MNTGKTSIEELLDFEIDFTPTKYLVSATADVWYDLTGVFFIYDVNTKCIIHTILIKDNSKKYKEVAILCFEWLMQYDKFELLKPYSDYETLYKIIDNIPIEEIKATKFLFDSLEEELEHDLMYRDGVPKIETLDISNEKLLISDKIDSIPSFLRNWSGGWAFSEIFIFDKSKNKFTYHFKEYCPYITDDEKTTDTRQEFANSFSDESKYLMLSAINPFQELWLFENGKLEKVLKQINQYQN